MLQRKKRPKKGNRVLKTIIRHNKIHTCQIKKNSGSLKGNMSL